MPTDLSISPTLQRIVLIGFMGAGKSTVGPILAAQLGWRFVDADRYLELKTGKSVAEIFSASGEPAFRHMEAEAAAELLEQSDLVVALGGGAVETESTRSLFNRDSTCVVFLKAPFEVLIDRCNQQPDAAVRPILRQSDSLGQRFHSRLPLYEQAHVTVETEGLQPADVALGVLQGLAALDGAWTLPLKAIAT